MACIVEFNDSHTQFEFGSQGSKQQVLIDILLRYGAMDIAYLASELNIPESIIRDTHNNNGFILGKQADDLAQFFLVFFGRNFFSKFSIIRNYL